MKCSQCGGRGSFQEIRADLESGAYPCSNVGTETACGYCSYCERDKMKGQNPIRDKPSEGKSLKRDLFLMLSERVDDE